MPITFLAAAPATRRTRSTKHGRRSLRFNGSPRPLRPCLPRRPAAAPCWDLKCEFQHELHLTWCAQTHRRCVKRQIYPAEVGSRNLAVRIRVIRLVEDVEHFGPESQL